jgi:hypothetical protein
MIKQTTMLLAALTVGGCAAVPIPADSLERNEASMRSAREVGALGVPAARLHLQMAKDQTATAKRLAADGDERGLLVLSRAFADAELALAEAREAAAHTDALRAAADLQAVQARVPR